MSKVRAAVMVVVSALATLLIGWGSRAPYQASDSDTALLRLSWRMRGERSETCRDRTQAELDALPVHMRTPRVCETRAVPYRLTLQIGDGAPDTTLIFAAGAKHDRPLYVLRDSVLAPGTRHVRVQFERADSVPAQNYDFDGELDFAAGYIELITLSDDGRALTHRTARQPSH